MSSASLTGVRFPVAHDDMLGKTRTAVTGASQTTIAQIRDTGFLLEWMAENSNDFQQITIQVPHWRNMGTALDSLHIHYALTTAPTAGNTVIFQYAYTWIQPGTAIPALSGWTSGTATLTFAGTEGANYYGLFAVVSNIAAPTNEGYGGIILMKLTRYSSGAGSDTYTGDVGILDIDAHSQKKPLRITFRSQRRIKHKKITNKRRRKNEI